MSSHHSGTLEYATLVRGNPIDGIIQGHTGIGTRNTWHGSPDASLRGSGSFLSVMKPMDEPASDVDTDGAVVKGDAKLQLQSSTYYKQLVSMSVVASYTAHNRHKTMSPLIPTLLISKEEAIACIFNPVTDHLLISDRVQIAHYCPDHNTSHQITKTGLLFLWVCINHRYVTSIPFHP